MRTIVVVLGLVGGIVLGCEALEPRWSEPVAVFPDSTCDEVCSLEGSLCMEAACGGATVQTLYSEPREAACEDEIGLVDDGALLDNTPVRCCCSTGAE